MGRPTKKDLLYRYKNLIEKKLYTYSKDKKIFNNNDLKFMLLFIKAKISIAKTTNFNEFSSFLISSKIMKLIMFEYSKDNRIALRYHFSKDEISDYKLAQSLSKKSFISHYSAMSYHDLTDNIPKRTYLNSEQTKQTLGRSVTDDLVQENIDRAFSKDMRKTTKFVYEKNENIEIVFLNSANTGNFGVESVPYKKDTIKVTSLERTLVDIVVRPAYSGGSLEILNAYKKARDKTISVGKIISILKKNDYIYPYEQSIGFLLEKANYDKKLVNRIYNICEKKYKFYLDYKIPEKNFSKKWNLYYPSFFDTL
jgi:predicted transcriptional regulator of viral defense system